MNQPTRTAHRLSFIVTILMFLQSAAGLLAPSLYQDNAFVKSAWHGNDIVTLIIATPLFIWCLFKDRQGEHIRARLGWLGLLAYSAYNYAFYLFGSHFSSLFLLFVALFTLSAYALCLGLANLDVTQVKSVFPQRLPVKGVSLYMLFWGLALSALWVGQSLNYVFTGGLPAMITATDHPTNITGALDLSMMVPAVLLGGHLLWRRRLWGFIIAVIMNIKGALYALVLTVSSFLGDRAGIPNVGAQVPLWTTLCAASLICLWVLLRKRTTE